jgi:hypothetical protein
MAPLDDLVWEHLWSKIFPGAPRPERRRADPRLLVAIFVVPIAFALLAWTAYGMHLLFHVLPPGLPFYPAVALSTFIGAASDGALRAVHYGLGCALVYLLTTACIVLAQTFWVITHTF